MVYENKPRAVLVSLGLSVMRGNVLIAALGESASHRSIPVVAITGFDASRERFESHEPIGYIDANGDVVAMVGEFLDQIGFKKNRQGDASVVGKKHRPRILLAEDSPTNQLILARILHVGGADVTVVGNGVEAVYAAEVNDFDMILMDIEMPEMDGLEAAAKMREKGIHTPIIAVTGHEEENIGSDEFDRNFNGFLQKPVDKEDIRTLFRLYNCGHGRQQAA